MFVKVGAGGEVGLSEAARELREACRSSMVSCWLQPTATTMSSWARAALTIERPR